MEALALTDLNGVYGAVRFQKACRTVGIRPIIGAEVPIGAPAMGQSGEGTKRPRNGSTRNPVVVDEAHPNRSTKDLRPPPLGVAAPLVLLCKSKSGYSNLCQLLTAAHLASREHPHVSLGLLAEYSGDLICLTGGRDGELFKSVVQGRYSDARLWLGQLAKIFTDRLFIELSHHLRPHDSAFVRKLHEIATGAHLPTIATGDVRYASPEDYRRYDLLTCVRLGWTVFNPHPERPVNAEAYLKEEAILRKLIPFDDAFENTVAVAAECDVDLLPGYVTPPKTLLHDGRTPKEELERLCWETVEWRYPIATAETGESQVARTEYGEARAEYAGRKADGGEARAEYAGRKADGGEARAECEVMLANGEVAKAVGEARAEYGTARAEDGAIGWGPGPSWVCAERTEQYILETAHPTRPTGPEQGQRPDPAAQNEPQTPDQKPSATSIGTPSPSQARRQLSKELGVICDLGLEEYFLVVREVVAEAKRRGIRCAGRGSAANSIVAYLLGITGVDPIAHNLLFERFLHGGRKGTPDIDVDFDSERREEVIAWMEERFGIEQTAMTANIITYQIRMALRDVAKTLGWPMSTVDKLSAAVPPRRARKVRDYRENLVEIVGESPLFEVLLDMVEALDDCPRHLGLHSGGMLLSRQPLFGFTPIQVSANGVKVAQFDKNDVEAMGLIKFDVLGLRMLASISESIELLRRFEGIELDVDELPLDDPETFDLIRSGRTLGLFQIESQGQMHLLAMHQPENFNDLISEIALFRPGPLQGGMVNPFVRRRRGEEPVTYDHPDLEPVLASTYGIILYQEQVLEVAHHFAGMTLAQADDFRSLMSKFRDPGEMEGMRDKFVAGAMRRGVDEMSANHVFDKVSNFVGYGFCRSHAAAFAKTVYQSAWLKRNHPAAYMAALMQHRPGMYNLMTLEEEARRTGVEILLPDINRSGMRYELERISAKSTYTNGRIRKPITSINKVTADSARAIIMARLDGAFVSVEDLYRRVALDRDVLESIARSGALDEIAGDSRTALWEVGVLLRRDGEKKGTSPLLRWEQSSQQDNSQEPDRSLSDIDEYTEASDNPQSAEQLTLLDMPLITARDIPVLPKLDERERLSWDYQMHGAARYHPMVLLRRMMTDLEVRSIDTCYRFTGPNSRTKPRGTKDALFTVAGIATLRQMPPTAHGVMFITLEDETGYMQCIVLPEVQEKYRALFRSAALIVRGRLQIHGGWRGIVVDRAWPLDNTIGGYSGHASAYGGTDRHLVEPPNLDEDPTDGTRASEYARDLMREVEELREEMRGQRKVEAGRR